MPDQDEHKLFMRAQTVSDDSVPNLRDPIFTLLDTVEGLPEIDENIIVKYKAGPSSSTGTLSGCFVSQVLQYGRRPGPCYLTAPLDL